LHENTRRSYTNVKSKLPVFVNNALQLWKKLKTKILLMKSKENLDLPEDAKGEI
jgi:hypothetical protein